MKIGVVVTMHHSEKNRPYGKELMDKFISTLYENLEYDFNLYIVDNQSDTRFDIESEGNNVWYHYVENQFETGLTGAWNLGIKKAISDNCDIILNVNDDIEFNPTINNFIDVIKNHKHKHLSFFGPVSDGFVGQPIQLQKGPIDSLIELPGVDWNSVIGGFFVGFTNKFFHKFKGENDNLFLQNHKYNEGDGKWGGQETIQILWKNDGAKIFVIGTCWIKHYKFRDWKIAKSKDKEITI